MALNTYTEVKSAIADWLDRSDLTSRIPDFIRLAELRIYRDLRIPPMEAVVTITSSSTAVELPSNYLEMKSMLVQGTPNKNLKRVSYRDQSKTTTSGIPSTYARKANEVIVHPVPDSSKTYELYYWADIGSITDEVDEQNWFTENAPDLLLYGALLEASPYLKDDERVAIWRAAFSESMRTVQNMADKSEHSGSGITVATTSGVY
jgi:hypothetical protein